MKKKVLLIIIVLFICCISVGYFIYKKNIPQNENISVVCDGKSEPSQLEQSYKLNIENIKKQGINIEEEFLFRNRKFICIKAEY